MTCDITEILARKSLTAYFQPVVSITEKRIIGLEGLIRGIDIDTGEIIPPLYLFNAAESKGLQTELDRACRETVLDTFKSIHRDDILLFLNLHSSILDKTAGSNHLLNTVRHFGITAQNIVIEINESEVKETSLLKSFTDHYRKEGFMIALDDIGCGFSNMDRISLIKPDIVKIDMSLVKNIYRNFYVREVFGALVNLSNKIGALVIAEGTETENEAIITLELGANMIQGYCLSKPQKINEMFSPAIEAKIDYIATKFKETEKDKLLQNQEYYNRLNSIANAFTGALANVSEHYFDDVLAKIADDNSIVECLYILDNNGIQVSNTVFPRFGSNIRRNGLFAPASKGTDHSLKSYYRYMKNAGISKYLTESYASLASGNLCVTFSSEFYDSNKTAYILCIDFKVEENKQLYFF
jgi:EAL domain-containing protein (putative c-di-GMP-specific phosphodiesterase class I)